MFGLTPSELGDEPIDLRYPAAKPGNKSDKSKVGAEKPKETGTPLTVPGPIATNLNSTTTTTDDTNEITEETVKTTTTIPHPPASPRQSQRIRKERVSRARSAVDMGSIL